MDIPIVWETVAITVVISLIAALMSAVLMLAFIAYLANGIFKRWQANSSLSIEQSMERSMELATHSADQRVEQAIKTHQQAITHENALSLERLRHELRLELTAHQSQTLRLHEKRADVTSTLYAKLVNAEEALNFVVQATRPLAKVTIEDSLPVASDTLNELRRHFGQNRLYIASETAQTLDALIHEMWGTVAVFVMAHREEDSAASRMQLARSIEKTLAQIPAIKMSIEQDFRQMIDE